MAFNKLMSPQSHQFSAQSKNYFGNADEGADMPPQDEYIQVVIYFYGEEAPLRERVFPMDK